MKNKKMKYHKIWVNPQQFLILTNNLHGNKLSNKDKQEYNNEYKRRGNEIFIQSNPKQYTATA